LNKEKFDKVIAKIKWCSFFASQCIIDISDKDGGHTNQSTISKNPMLHAQTSWLYVL